MSSKRKVSNPLALAVLACLFERPMHPYEMATTMRQRGKDASIKLNYGSLYSVVESLLKQRLIAVTETEREGNRPERTVYQLTDAGRLELIDWLNELLGTPVKEYTQFEAGLCLLAVLQPEDALARLRDRVNNLEIEIAQGKAMRDLVIKKKLPRLLWIEHEYVHMQRVAELKWVRELIHEISEGTLEGQDRWKGWHQVPRVEWAESGPDAGDSGKD